LHLFAAKRVDIESFRGDMEAAGRARVCSLYGPDAGRTARDRFPGGVEIARWLDPARLEGHSCA
jgi:hypothetical protein